MQFYYRNVNAAFVGLVRLIDDGQLPVCRRASRYGPVMQVQEPVTLTYLHPRERVLLNSARDANPFFHLYESLWMLAGRNDVSSLKFYNGRMPEFSDNGHTFNGAYGHRWRYATRTAPVTFIDGYGGGGHKERVDQLDVLVKHLQANPDSRRAVLQMWNVEDDLIRIDDSRDVCCNLSVVFKLCDEPAELDPKSAVSQNTAPVPPPRRVLDVMVFNRSNDLVWGMLGANVVQFSVLQEYVAARLGAGVGRYHHVTADLHAYLATWKPDAWLAAEDAHHGLTPENQPFPLVTNPEAFERQLPEFVEAFSGGHPANDHAWTEPFLQQVAAPLLRAYHVYRADRLNEANVRKAVDEVLQVADPLWRQAAHGWLVRRAARSTVLQPTGEGV